MKAGEAEEGVRFCEVGGGGGARRKVVEVSAASQAAWKGRCVGGKSDQKRVVVAEKELW